MTSRPLSVGSFLTSRSMLRSNVRAVASRRSTSSRVTSVMEMKCRRGGCPGGRRSSRMTWISPMVLLLGVGDEQDAVDLVHLDELHLDALVARGRKVLADVVRTDRQLAVAAVDEDGELDALGTAVVEERLDRGTDRPAGVEHVVDEDDGLALERKVERGRADDRLRMAGRVAAAHLHVVPVEGDVHCAEVGRFAGALLDETAQPLRERHAARLDADECDLGEVGVGLDELVRDPCERPPERFVVEEDGSRRGRHGAHCRRGSAVVWACSVIRLLSGPHWTGLKGCGSRGTLTAPADGLLSIRTRQG